MVPAGRAAAQQQRQTPVSTIVQDDGASPGVAPRRIKGFSLFGQADLAAAGMRMTGGMGAFFPNVGPCPFYFYFNTEVCFLTQQPSGSFVQQFFEIGLLAAAPISDYRKIRAVWPGVASMQPPLGYTAPHTEYLVTPQSERFGPGDDEFGNLFSGASATTDGSCRDFSDNLNGRVPSGFTLLAASDCPVTWPGSGFGGPRPVIDSARVAAFRRSPNSFHFNDWQLPPSAFDTTQFLGSFSTYGTISDSYREIIQRYGSVTKLGSGASQERGFPLGLDIRMDAWQFSRPSIRNAVFWQLTIVNHSDRIYGTGVDYDSLYVGLQPGILVGGQAQGESWYQDMARGSLILARGNLSGKCSATYPRRTASTGGCTTTDGPTRPIFAFAFLKSPIGDLRNKLLSDSTSPYYNPTSPFADDTITYNHAGRAGFGFLYNSTTVRNDKSLFGYMASIEDVFLDGRTIADFSDAQVYQLFQNEKFNGVKTPEVMRFNRFVPSSTPGYGQWSYYNQGTPDTIYVPTCGSQGCVTNFADTTAAGLYNFVSNIGNVVAIGPFRLRAGDTTQLLVSFMGAPDSSSFESLLNSVIGTYLANYAGPAPVPPPTFTSADVQMTPAVIRDVTEGQSNSEIRIRIPQTPSPIDPFITSALAKLNSSDPHVQRLLALNPNLIAEVSARQHNYSRLLVFKSCDRGQNFTVTQDCTPAPARDPQGHAIGFGWQPWQVIKVDTATGIPTRTAITDVVVSGRTYLYSFVTQTQGLKDIKVVDSTKTGGVVATTLGEALGLDADTVSSPLFRNGPHTVIAYAPITLPAGTVMPVVDTITVSGRSTQRLSVVPTGAVSAGVYQTIFANRFIVLTDRDTVHNRSTQTVIAQRVLAEATTAPGGPVASDVVVGADTLRRTGEVVISGGTAPANRTGSTDSIVHFADTLTASGLGFVLTRNGAGAGAPLFISLKTSGTTTDLFAAATDFPGFTVAPVTELVPRTNATVRGPGDTLNATVVTADGVRLQSDSTTLVGAGGLYQVVWGSDAFGAASPFRLTTKSEMQPAFTQSLLGRPDSTIGDTTTAIATLLGLTASSRPLVPARFPFSIITPNGTKAILAMQQRNAPGAADSAVRNSVLLGNLGDTVRLDVPVTEWVPDDPFYVIERTTADSVVTIGGSTVPVLHDTVIAGRTVQAPIQVPTTAVAFAPMSLACNSNTTPARRTCNPIALTTIGSTAYLPYKAGWKNVIDYARPFDLFSQVQLTATPLRTNSPAATAQNLSKVRVVPNPYIVQSLFDKVDAARTGTAQIYFTNVPEQGVIRIYTASGQFVQQLSWTRGDLVDSGTGSVNGDLPYNLRSREGLDLATGLYLYVLTATGPSEGGKVVRGKFVIIR